MMAIKFFYRNTPYIQIETISVVGAFNDYDEFKTPLLAVKGGWEANVDLEPGKHHYKFIVNGVLRLNDPNATLYVKDREGEVWSVAYVDFNREIETQKDHGMLQLTNFVITNKTMDLVEESRYKDHFNLNMDSTVVAGFEFSYIKGVHTITVVWVNSLYHIHHISDHYIEVKEGEEDDAADIWFWIDLKEKHREYPLGTWYVKLFVDGEFLVEDKFTIGRGGTYQATSKGIVVNQGIDLSN